MPDESTVRLDCGVETERCFGEAVAVYRDLVNLGVRIIRRTGTRDTRGLADEVAVTMLLQSQNAAMACFTLLCEGYPRMALHLARLIREGHVAFRWALHNPDAAAEHFTEFRAGTAWPNGTWPKVGDMAQQLSPDLRESAWYQEFQRAYRDTHNEIFSHAISDWALRGTMHNVTATGWTTALGPTFDETLVAEGFGHTIPLLAWHVVDCADFVDPFVGMGGLADELHAALDRAIAWIAAHPTFVVHPPQS